MEAAQVRLLVLVALLLFVSVATVDRSPPLTVDGPLNLAVPPAVEPAGTSASDTNADAEVARIRNHLLRVERELISADVSHLTAAQRANRTRQIRVLREYRERGVFPHNHEVEGAYTPVFIDEHGTHCAVGYLIARSGHEELARRIAATRNLAVVDELVDIPELAAWLEETGLSVDEAARIQPWYGHHPPEQRTDAGFATATAVYAGLGGGIAVWNVMTDRTGDAWWLPGAAGVTSGIAGVMLAGAGAGRGNSEVSGKLIGINAGVGLLSAVLGTRTLLLGRTDRPSAGDRTTLPQGSPAELSLSPWTGHEGGAGVHLTLRF